MPLDCVPPGEIDGQSRSTRETCRSRLKDARLQDESREESVKNREKRPGNRFGEAESALPYGPATGVRGCRRFGSNLAPVRCQHVEYAVKSLPKASGAPSCAFPDPPQGPKRPRRPDASQAVFPMRSMACNVRIDSVTRLISGRCLWIARESHHVQKLCSES